MVNFSFDLPTQSGIMIRDRSDNMVLIILLVVYSFIVAGFIFDTWLTYLNYNIVEQLQIRIFYNKILKGLTLKILTQIVNMLTEISKILYMDQICVFDLSNVMHIFGRKFIVKVFSFQFMEQLQSKNVLSSYILNSINCSPDP